MGKNTKNDKKQRNEEAAKLIKEKQSQKKNELRRIEKRKESIEKEKKKIEEEKQERRQQEQQRRREEKAARKQESKKAKREQGQSTVNSGIKTKEQERKEFIGSIGNLTWYEKRVDAEVADQKRKEAYLKYVDYTPKLEEKKYCGKAWEGTYKRWDGKGDR